MNAKCCPFREGKNESAAPNSNPVSKDFQWISFCSFLPNMHFWSCLRLIVSNLVSQGMWALSRLPCFISPLFGNRTIFSLNTFVAFFLFYSEHLISILHNYYVLFFKLWCLCYWKQHCLVSWWWNSLAFCTHMCLCLNDWIFLTCIDPILSNSLRFMMTDMLKKISSIPLHS